VLDDQTLIYRVERNGDGEVKVKIYLPLGYTQIPDQDWPLNRIKFFYFVSMKINHFKMGMSWVKVEISTGPKNRRF
jgi:hypothetical protein